MEKSRLRSMTALASALKEIDATLGDTMPIAMRLEISERGNEIELSAYCISGLMFTTITAILANYGFYVYRIGVDGNRTIIYYSCDRVMHGKEMPMLATDAYTQSTSEEEEEGDE